MVALYLLLMAVGYAAALGLLLRRLCIPGRGYLPEKTFCSVCFLAVAAACAALGGQMGAFWVLLPALVLCLCGDVVLAVYNRCRRPGWFLGGLVLFLGGHALFVAVLCRRQPSLWPVLASGAAGMAGVLLLARLPQMRLGRMKPWAILYAAFVSALAGKAAQVALVCGGSANWWFFAGAVLFWISDLLILFLYFYRKKHLAVHIANLLTYYAAMFCIGASLAFR